MPNFLLWLLCMHYLTLFQGEFLAGKGEEAVVCFSKQCLSQS